MIRSVGLSSPTSTILAQQFWQGGAGLLTVVCVATFLTPTEQGWYYTLASLAALSTLMDFGLSAVLLQRAARCFLNATWNQGAPEGEAASAITTLAAWGQRYYLKLAGLFLIIIVPGGSFFLVQTAGADHGWWPVFLSLMVLTALGLVPQPFLFLIEGSGRVASVYALRLVQGVAGAMALWAILVFGGGLWAMLAIPVAAVLVPFAMMALRYRGLAKSAWRDRAEVVDWRGDVWPLQWRIGLSMLAAYLLSQLATPILFEAQGPAAAGQMGLSLALCNMIGLIARARFIGHVPMMTQAAHRRDWAALRQLYQSDGLWFCIIFAGGSLAAMSLLHAFSDMDFALRVLPWPIFSALLLTIALINVQTILAAQLRAFGEEPLLVISVVGAGLTVVCCSFAAHLWGSAGVVGAMLCVQLFVVLPFSLLVWRRFHFKHGYDPTLTHHRYSDL